MNERIASAAQTKELIRRHGFGVKKSLGQNFLVDGRVLDKIINAAGITQNDLVIEVGPGLGALTQALCEAAQTVVAVEIDKELAQILRENLAGYANLEIVNADILKLDLAELLRARGYLRASVSVVANLPYYITTPVIMKLLEGDTPVSGVTVMVQKEVAFRMAAQPGTKDYGALTLAVGYRAGVSLVANVPRNCFIPRPGVDSAVIRLTPWDKPPVDVGDERLFFSLIKAAFANRRKTLLNCLCHSGLAADKPEAAALLTGCGLDVNIRGEALGLHAFARLTRAMLKAHAKPQ